MIPYKNLNDAEFRAALSADQEPVIVDVRRPEEWAEGIIPNALKINIMDVDFGAQIDELDRDKSYFIYCRSGGRSARACEYMASLGFKKLVNLQGGMLGWNGAVES